MLQQREGTNLRVILLFVLLIFLSPFLNADVISINAGGSGNIIINPDKFIEGFFFCSPQTCSDLNVECETVVEQCGTTLDCGACATGETCTAGSCVAVPVTPPVTPGNGAGPAAPTVTISVTPTEINIDMAINTAVDRTITVKNLGTSSVNVSITQTNLDDMVILSEGYLYLAGGETKTFNARFVAPGTPDTYTGKIKVGNKEVSVALNVKTKRLLFDSNIVVLNEDYQVPQGQKLKTKVTLIPLGDKERLDITLNYEMKDYDGNVYLTKSETLLIEDRVEFKRNFDTGMLPLGKYIIGLELVYTGGVAPSSAHFEVIEPVVAFGKLILFLIIAILILAILILLILIIRYLKKKRAEGVI